jgi:hypothetical protein
VGATLRTDLETVVASATGRKGVVWALLLFDRPQLRLYMAPPFYGLRTLYCTRKTGVLMRSSGPNKSGCAL